MNAAAWLGGTLLAVVLMLAFNGFVITPRIGGVMLLMYVAFVVYMIAMDML